MVQLKSDAFPCRCWPTIVFGKTVPWISGWLPQRRRSIMGSGELPSETTVLFLHLSDFRMVKSSSSSSRHQWRDAARLGDQVGPEKVAALRQVQRSGVWHPHRKQRRLLRQVRDEPTLLLFCHGFTSRHGSLISGLSFWTSVQRAFCDISVLKCFIWSMLHLLHQE